MDNNTQMPQTQNVPSAQVPASGGTEDLAKTVAELKAKTEQFEREKKGILSDLQSEREKRQNAEAELEKTRTTRPVAGSPATAPVNSVPDPIQAALMEIELDRTMNWLAKKEKRDPEDIRQDQALHNKLIETAAKWGITGRTAFDSAQKAYEIWKKEEALAQFNQNSTEATRTSAINQNTPVTTTAPAPSSNRVWTLSEVKNLNPLTTSLAVMAEIKQAQAEGRFDGTR